MSQVVHAMRRIESEVVHPESFQGRFTTLDQIVRGQVVGLVVVGRFHSLEDDATLAGNHHVIAVDACLFERATEN